MKSEIVLSARDGHLLDVGPRADADRVTGPCNSHGRLNARIARVLAAVSRRDGDGLFDIHPVIRRGLDACYAKAEEKHHYRRGQTHPSSSHDVLLRCESVKERTAAHDTCLSRGNDGARDERGDVLTRACAGAPPRVQIVCLGVIGSSSTTS
jgi:hypothetical protein